MAMVLKASLLAVGALRQANHLRTQRLQERSAFLRCWDQIQDLRKACALDDDKTTDPAYFLSGTDKVRRSRSVACWDEDRLIGILYATERYHWGIRSGYGLAGDYSGSGLLVCRAEDEAAVVSASIREIMACGIHSLHVRMTPRDITQAEFPGNRTVYLDAIVPGDRLPLPATFSQFLARLGRHTRRNIRNFTRKTAASGIEFVPSLTQQEYEAAILTLNAKTDFRVEPRRLARDSRHMALCGGGQRMGLRGPDGRLAAVLCGFSHGRRFHLLTQLNDASFKRLSLSVVLRARAIEHLIGTGHTELQLVGGSSNNLGRYCSPQRYRSLIVDRDTGLAAIAKSLTSHLAAMAEHLGTPLPRPVQTFCRGFLQEQKLPQSTPLGTLALANAHNRIFRK